MKITVADVRRRVNSWRTILGLSDLWDISIKVETSEEDVSQHDRTLAASINVTLGNYQALLTVNAWQDEAQKDLDGLVAHELLHVVLYPIETALKDGMPEMKRTRHVLIEQAVEGLGQSLMRLKKARIRK